MEFPRIADKAMVILSGGQDSTTCMFWAKQCFNEVHAVTFRYGQRHSYEVQASRIVAGMGGIDSHEVIDLGAILKGTSPLVSDSELEQYENSASLPGGLEKTFVPMRNQLFITLAANRAYVKGITYLVTGVCQEDSGGYPDCTQGFITAIENAISHGTFTNSVDTLPYLKIITPLMNMTKAESIHFAKKIPGAYSALAYTHTAYDGKYPPTGKDHATLLREKGFFESGYPDPLVLRAYMDGRMELPKTPNYAKLSDQLIADILRENWQ